MTKIQKKISINLCKKYYKNFLKYFLDMMISVMIMIVNLLLMMKRMNQNLVRGEGDNIKGINPNQKIKIMNPNLGNK